MKEHAREYDLTLKDILSGIEKNFVKAFLHFDIKSAEALNIEFPKIEEKIADYVCKIEDLENKKYILHIELQSQNHKIMHIRMARYLIELYHQYDLPIIQVVIYIGKEKLTMKNEIKFKTLNTRIDYKYNIIDVKTIDCEKLLKSDKSDLVILAILCDFEDRDKNKVVREILKRLNELNLNDEVEKGNYILKLEVLSKLRNLEEIVIKEEDMLDAIKMEDMLNFKRGKLVGIEEGEKRGIERGIEKGIEKEKLHIALNMLKAGINIKDIATFTELSIEQIKSLQFGKN